MRFLVIKNMTYTNLTILRFLYLKQGSRLPDHHRDLAMQKKKKKNSLNLSVLASVSSSVASGSHH
jgi:hypothetical protein